MVSTNYLNNRYFRKTTSDSWSELDISKKSRLALIDDVISSESSSSSNFAVGTLVVMLYQPTEDDGYYRCNATYTTPGVGTSTSYVVSQYQMTGNGN